MAKKSHNHILCQAVSDGDMSEYMLLLYDELSSNEGQAEIVLNNCSLKDIKEYLERIAYDDPMPLENYEVVKKTKIDIVCNINLKEQQ